MGTLLMRTTRIIVSLVALALASGCADHSDKSSTSRGKLLIAVVPKAT